MFAAGIAIASPSVVYRLYSGFTVLTTDLTTHGEHLDGYQGVSRPMRKYEFRIVATQCLTLRHEMKSSILPSFLRLRQPKPPASSSLLFSPSDALPCHTQEETENSIHLLPPPLRRSLPVLHFPFTHRRMRRALFTSGLLLLRSLPVMYPHRSVPCIRYG
jgi:hypothetical protein